MFQRDYGFGPAKWLPWFFAAAVVYALLTLIPAAEHVVLKITTIAVAVIGTALRKQIAKWLFSRD